MTTKPRREQKTLPAVPSGGARGTRRREAQQGALMRKKIFSAGAKSLSKVGRAEKSSVKRRGGRKSGGKKRGRQKIGREKAGQSENRAEKRGKSRNIFTSALDFPPEMQYNR